jgi:hypothetical protein
LSPLIRLDYGLIRSTDLAWTVRVDFDKVSKVSDDPPGIRYMLYNNTTHDCLWLCTKGHRERVMSQEELQLQLIRDKGRAA